MPTIAERLEQIELKFARAQKHVRDLEAAIATFLATRPYKVSTRHDPDSRRLIYYVSAVAATPKELSLIAGDAVQNLMSALDHLAYQLVCSDTADAPPNRKWIYFPIADSQVSYEKKRLGKIEGASTETANAIDALRPYRGGDDRLYKLYALNNIEKHRLLVTVGSSLESVDIGGHGFRRALELWGRAGLSDAQIESMSLHYRPTDNLFPLAVGNQLLIDLPDAKVDEKLEFRFAVSLAEQDVIEPQSVLKTLSEFSAAVENAVQTLAPRLKATL